MLIDPEAPLKLRWRYLPQLLPWLFGFLAASRPSRVREISEALAELMAPAIEAYLPLVQAAGASDLIQRQGLLNVFRDPRAFAALQPELALRQELGITAEILDTDQLRERVPALHREVYRGVYYPDVAHTVDPYGLVQALVRRLVTAGGRITQCRAVGFDFVDGRVTAVRTDDGVEAADIVVVAAGAWSKEIAAWLGVRVPLDTERGYHVTLANPGIDVPLPLVAGDKGIAITPMAAGLRLAGTVEFAGLEAPPDPVRHANLLKAARRILPELQAEPATTWMGFRPSMPDSLPVIGPAPRYANAFLAFGHGHIGLTLAAVTGAAIADLAAGRQPVVSLAPCRPERFA
jgi:D-amino-acid dehydrogenase